MLVGGCSLGLFGGGEMSSWCGEVGWFGNGIVGKSLSWRQNFLDFFQCALLALREVLAVLLRL